MMKAFKFTKRSTIKLEFNKQWIEGRHDLKIFGKLIQQIELPDGTILPIESISDVQGIRVTVREGRNGKSSINQVLEIDPFAPRPLKLRGIESDVYDPLDRRLERSGVERSFELRIE